MAAAHRGALGALGVLLDHGATINLSDEMGATGGRAIPLADSAACAQQIGGHKGEP